MELRHLRYFVAVAEAENVTRAARKLHVSQPGVSRQVRDLEDEIGFRLFERGARSLRLTAAGAVFLTEARGLLERADEAVAKARAVAGGTADTIAIGYAPSLTVRILPPMLRRFQDRFPNAHVALHDLATGEMLSQLGSGKLQLALTVRPGAKLLRGFSFKELARYGLRVAMMPTHPLAKSKTLSLHDLAPERIIVYSRKDYPEYHSMLDKLFALAAARPRIAGEHDSVSSLIAAVESGHGYALVPECLDCMVGSRLRLIPLKPSPPPISVGAIWAGHDLSGVAKEFIGAAKEAAMD